MKRLLAVILAAGLLCPCTHAQQSDEVRRFLEYKAKAERGDAAAQVSLGQCYDKGLGVEKDYAESVKWFRKAAEQDHARAQFNLGGSYHSGIGVGKDYEEAVKWFRKAAEQDNANAQIGLGVCYYDGNGVEKNSAEAYAWWNLASKTDKNAAETRDKLEKTMSPQQVSDAQKRTKELRVQIETRLKAGK